MSRVGKTWCDHTREGMVLASVTIKDIKTGKELDGYSCTWDKIMGQ